MNELDGYRGEIVEGRIAVAEPPPEQSGRNMSGLVLGVLRYWYLVLIVSVAMCAVGIPVIWLGIGRAYEVTGAIRIAPIIPNILTGEADRGEVSNYQSFMNTQAELIRSPQVVERVADELAGRQLTIFESKPSGLVEKVKYRLGEGRRETDLARRLKSAVTSRVITVEPGPRTELMKITMRTEKPEEAALIVNAFIRAYMAVEGLKSIEGDDKTLSVLENERKVLSEKLDNQRDAIKQLGQEYGSTSLDGRHSMMLSRVSSLLSELTSVEAKRMGLESHIRLLEEKKDTGSPSEEIIRQRDEYINANISVQELTRQVAQLEQDLLLSRQVMVAGNPLLQQKEDFVKAFQSRLDEKREEIGKKFDEQMAKQVDKASIEKLANANLELEQTLAYETRLREMLAKEDSDTVELGRKQLAIEEMKEQLVSTKEMYDQIRRRIQELEMERKRPARVSVAYEADVAAVIDKRMKLTIALAFAAAAAGIAAALIRDKADTSLRSPDDVVKRIGIRIIGTTASPETVKKALLARQLSEDYQTIRANLGLLDGGALPKKLVVTSPGMRDGKTTLAINFATSMARAGKRVLLIDGDLRKPDIGRLLNLPKDCRCLQDVLCGGEIDGAVCAVQSSGLHVLAAHSHNKTDPYELLVSSGAAQRLEEIGREYDHLIIDTPPVLAFPDALIWARMADAVILASFAGRTRGPDLNEAKQRLLEIGVRILGTVLNNVDVGLGYYRYGYNYYSQGGRAEQRARDASRRPLLLPLDKPSQEPGDSVS